jgi:hypothetical protein
VGTDHDTGAFAVASIRGWWRGEPLRDYETVVRLIAGTTKAKGLKVTCRLDHRRCPVGRKIADEEFAHVNLKPDKFHGEWNYTIHPSN